MSSESIQSWYCSTPVTFTLGKPTNLCSCHKLTGFMLVAFIGASAYVMWYPFGFRNVKFMKCSQGGARPILVYAKLLQPIAWICYRLSQNKKLHFFVTCIYTRHSNRAAPTFMFVLCLCCCSVGKS